LISTLTSKTTAKIVSSEIDVDTTLGKITLNSPIHLSDGNLIQIEKNEDFPYKYEIKYIHPNKQQIIFQNVDSDGIDKKITQSEIESLINKNVIYGSYFDTSMLSEIPSKNFPVFIIDIISRNVFQGHLNQFIPTEVEFMALAMSIVSKNNIDSVRKQTEISLMDMMNILAKKIKDPPLFNATIYKNNRVIMVGCTFLSD